MEGLGPAARLHLDLGHSLVPVNAKKKPHFKALVETGYHRPGFHPQTGEAELRASWKRLQSEAPPLDTVRAWVGLGAGLAVVTGTVSGLVIIDVDHPEGTARFDTWGLTSRAHVRSPSGGLHWYVHHPGWAVQTLQSQTVSALETVRGIDIRADGGYAVIPPTQFADKQYDALRSVADKDQAALLPDEVLHLLGLDAPPAPKQAAQQAERRTSSAGLPSSGGHSKTPLTETERGLPLGEVLVSRAVDRVYAGESRNPGGLWLALQLRDNGYEYSEAQVWMNAYVQQMPALSHKGEADPYTVGEAYNSLEQAFTRPAREAWHQSTGARLAELWLTCTSAERHMLCLCAHGLREEYRDDIWTALRGLDPEMFDQAGKEHQRRKQQRQVTPGWPHLQEMMRRLSRETR